MIPIDVRIHTFIHTFIHTYIDTYTHVYYIYTVYICIYIYVYIYIYHNIYMCVYVCSFPGWPKTTNQGRRCRISASQMALLADSYAAPRWGLRQRRRHAVMLKIDWLDMALISLLSSVMWTLHDLKYWHRTCTWDSFSFPCAAITSNVKWGLINPRRLINHHCPKKKCNLKNRWSPLINKPFGLPPINQPPVLKFIF